MKKTYRIYDRKNVLLCLLAWMLCACMSEAASSSQFKGSVFTACFKNANSFAVFIDACSQHCQHQADFVVFHLPDVLLSIQLSTSWLCRRQVTVRTLYHWETGTALAEESSHHWRPPEHWVGPPGTNWRSSNSQRRLRSFLTDRHLCAECSVCHVWADRSDHTQVQLSPGCRYNSHAPNVVTRLRVPSTSAIRQRAKPWVVAAANHTAGVTATSQAAQIKEVTEAVGIVDIDASSSLRLLPGTVLCVREPVRCVSGRAGRLRGVHRACDVSVRGPSAAVSLCDGRWWQLWVSLWCWRVIISWGGVGGDVRAASASQVAAACTAVSRLAMSLVLSGADGLPSVRCAAWPLRGSAPGCLDLPTSQSDPLIAASQPALLVTLWSLCRVSPCVLFIISRGHWTPGDNSCRRQCFKN